LGALEALMPTYSKSFKANIVKKITSPNGISSVALSKELNIPYATIRRWVRTYGATTMSENQAKANRRKYSYTLFGKGVSRYLQSQFIRIGNHSL